MLGIPETLTEHELWMDDALCAQTDPEMFFPEKGGSTRAAKAICAQCPVASMCLDYALRKEEHFGIWGGLSERERRGLRRGEELKQTAVQARQEHVRRLHAQGLMDPEVAIALDMTSVTARRLRKSLGLPPNGSGGVRKSAMKADPQPRAKKQEETMTEVKMTKPRHPKWAVRRPWVAIAPDGTIVGPFESREAAMEHVGAQLRLGSAEVSGPAETTVEVEKPTKRVYRRWTDDDTATMLRLRAEGLGQGAIAAAMGRSSSQISTKLRGVTAA